MPTVTDVARKTVAAIGADISYMLVCDWVSERYCEMANRIGRMRHLRKLGQVIYPAPLTAGTVTTTLGSTLVTGDATAYATWSNAVIDRWFRVSGNWYHIVQVGPTTITLEAPFTETGGVGQGYTILSRHIQLDADVRHLSSFIHRRRGVTLTMVPYEWLQESFPYRSGIGGGPQFVAEVPPEISLSGAQQKTVELFPYSSTVETIDYVYWSKPPVLSPGDELPQGVDDQVLKAGVLIDVMRYEMSKALRLGQMEIAATWRNDYRAQETVWDRKIREAIRADRGPDDTQSNLELSSNGYRTDGPPNAHTYVYDNWSR